MIVAVLCLLACGWLISATARLPRWPRRRTFAGVAGLAVLATAALLSGAADHRLSAHVAEHQVIVLAVAPLLAAAAPVRLALAVSRPPARRLIARALHHPLARLLAQPVTALALFCAAMLAVHLPASADAGLRHPLLHAAQHAALLWSSLLLWMVVLGADPLPVRLGAVGRVGLVVATMTAMAAIGATLAAARAPAYAAYPDVADQHTAGGLLWMAGMVAALPLLLGCAWSALRAEERRQQARDLHGVSR